MAILREGFLRHLDLIVCRRVLAIRDPWRHANEPTLLFSIMPCGRHFDKLLNQKPSFNGHPSKGLTFGKAELRDAVLLC